MANGANGYANGSNKCANDANAVLPIGSLKKRVPIRDYLGIQK